VSSETLDTRASLEIRDYLEDLLVYRELLVW
jgi:hypothetical protein